MWEWCVVQWIEHLSYVGVVYSSVDRALVLYGSGV